MVPQTSAMMFANVLPHSSQISVQMSIKTCPEHFAVVFHEYFATKPEDHDNSTIQNQKLHKTIHHDK